ncbi:MAG: nickel pincer cofactor biosynthesis protein LarC [Anaerohalosphaera sp.]|nr:nickel pincer cofactor biosynthesis protein LarC [Anaerohalosphaera sp.]
MKIGYFDSFAGAAGDMVVGAMIDAGVDATVLIEQISTLGIGGYSIETSRVDRGGISAVLFDPNAAEEHTHRNLADIRQIIDNSGLADSVKARAIAIFQIIAVAEAKVHGVTVDEVHFHEVGAVDSIVDVVAACVALDMLGVEKVYCSALPMGSGTVKCAHGVLSVPVPATVEILRTAAVPVVAGLGTTEMVTPTGAAILANFADSFTSLPDMVVDNIGYGAGQRDCTQYPNVVRLMVGTATMPNESDSVCVIETNIDDSTGEIIGYVAEKLMTAGALDVYTTAITMKSGRPAVKLTVICEVEMANQFEDIIFAEGLTLGLRRQTMHRSKLERQIVTVDTVYGCISIKVGRRNGQIVSVKPEFKDCQLAAQTNKAAVTDIIREATRVFYKDLPK